MACWNPSTLHTNMGLQELPAGIHLPQIPIEDYKGIPIPHLLALIIGHGYSFIIHSKPFCGNSRFDPLLW
jgi:hypothetical protein